MIDITGYVNLALLVVGVWFVFSVQRYVRQIAEDVRAIRVTQLAGLPIPAPDPGANPRG
jgi:uncharacterized membrane protein